MELLAAAARAGFEGKVPGPEEYKFRLFIEMEVSSAKKGSEGQTGADIWGCGADGFQGREVRLAQHGDVGGEWGAIRQARYVRSSFRFLSLGLMQAAVHSDLRCMAS